MFELKPWQSEYADRINASTGCVLGLGVGSGKTAIAIEAARRRGDKRVLIVAPLGTFDGWFAHIKWMTGEDAKFCANSKVSISYAPDPARRGERVERAWSVAEVKNNMSDALNHKEAPEGWFIIGREMFQRQDWASMPHPKGLKDGKTGKVKKITRRLGVWKNFDTIIYDECQMASNRNSRTYDTLRTSGAKYKHLQSADWFGNKLENMLSIARIVWPDRYKMTIKAFKDDYLVTEYDPYTWDKRKVVGEKWPGEFASTFPAYVAAPPPFEQPEPSEYMVDLSPAHMKAYLDMEKKFAAELMDGTILSIDYKQTVHIRLREWALGEFTLDENGDVVFPVGAPSAKLDAVRLLMRDYPSEPFLVFTHSEKFAQKAAVDLGGEAWTGKTSQRERGEIKDRFLGGETRVIVATDAIAEGVDGLQLVCRNLVRLTPVYNELKNRQVVGRLARPGQERQVNLWDVVARDTRDVGVLHDLRIVEAMNTAAKGMENND